MGLPCSEGWGGDAQSGELSGKFFHGPIVRVVGQQYDLRPIAGIELLHDLPEMHLDGALAHAELIGDYLGLLALPQLVQHLLLTR